MVVKCPVALRQLLDKIKRKFFRSRNRKFVEKPDSKLFSPEKFSAVLNMDDAHRHFFPQMRLEYDQYPRLFEMQDRDGKTIKVPSMLNLREKAKERMVVCHSLMMKMRADDMIVEFGPEQVQGYMQLEL